jgi:Uma2 family endonuclease
MKGTKVTPATNRPANGQGSLWEQIRAWEKDPVMQRIRPKGTPHFYGGEEEMGEATIHTITAGILLYGLGFHFASLRSFRVFANLNLYFSDDPAEFITPDVMVIKSPRALPEQLASYRIGPDTPAPKLVGEVLSPRTWQKGDLTAKPMMYSNLGVEEYLLADVTAEMLEQRLLLLRRRPDGKWDDGQDADGGITSRLGFRVVVEADGQLRVSDAKTGKRYIRPAEGQASEDRAQAAEERLRAAEAELARLRGTPAAEESAKKAKGRRRKS